MWPFCAWITATEWFSLILLILISMNLQQPWNPGIHINTACLLTTKQVNNKSFFQKTQ